MNWKRKLNNRSSLGNMTEDDIKLFPSQEKENELSGNKIYYYDDITLQGMCILNKQIDELTKHLKDIQTTYSLNNPPVIELHLSTEGGDIFSSFSAVDKIINNSIPIHIYCEGVVASSGTLLSCVANKRFITKHSCMLIHQVKSTFWGNYSQFQDEVTNLSLIMEIINKIYTNNTKLTKKELSNLLKRDLYMNSETCLEKGLVDEII